MSRKHSAAITTRPNGSSHRNSNQTTSEKCGISEIKVHNPFIVTRTAVVVDLVETGNQLRRLREFFDTTRAEIAKLTGWNLMRISRIERGDVSSKSIALLAEKYANAVISINGRESLRDRFDLKNQRTWQT